MNNHLKELLKAAKEVFSALTPEDKEEMLRKQSASYVRSCKRGDMTDEEWARWN